MAYTQENRLIAHRHSPRRGCLAPAGIHRPGGDVAAVPAFTWICSQKDSAIPFNQIVGQRVTITDPSLADGRQRYINGFVSRFAQTWQ